MTYRPLHKERSVRHDIKFKIFSFGFFVARRRRRRGGGEAEIERDDEDDLEEDGVGDEEGESGTGGCTSGGSGEKGACGETSGGSWGGGRGA